MYILIVGSSIKEYVLAKHILQNKSADMVFVAPGNEKIAKIANCINIDRTNIEELIEFVKANEIGLTITFDEQALSSGIADAFNEANLTIFAPIKDAARIATSKAVSKKFMYKTKILTPKFSVSDKESSAIEYLRNTSYPVVIKSDSSLNGQHAIVCKNFSQAKRITELKFLSGNEKIIIEDFIEGKEYSLYFITDGYNAIPLMCVVPYKYSLDGSGGIITTGMGAYAPAQDIDKTIIDKILERIIYPALKELARHDNSFIGVFGADIIITPYNDIYTIGFNSGFNSPDINVILNLMKSNFVDICKAAVIGSLADEYKEFDFVNKVSTAAALTAPNFWKINTKNSVIEGLENLDDNVDVIPDEVCLNQYSEYETNGIYTMILSTVSATLSESRRKLYENIERITFNDKKYIKDIGYSRTSNW